MENGKIVMRNLQQQVGKNKDDIQALSQGIKIRGFGENVPEDLKPGESWLKGTGPYELIVMTDGGQINLGQWPAKGPQGIPGPKGEGAVLGDVSTETTTLEPGLNAYVDVVKDGENLNFRFEIPQGERGIQGLKGETGPKGDTGPQGPQGPQGEARAVSEIVGTLESAAALPAPSTVPSYYAYLVGKENDYTVYAIVGGVWKDIGNFTAIQGPQGEKGESYGTFTKTVTNGKELGQVLSGLTDTQSIVGAYATSGNKRTELTILTYNKVDMIYAWSTTAEEAPDEPTAATWQAVTSPEGEARFPVGDNWVDSITLYIYDSSKSLMDKVSFIKLEDDGILPQSQIPRYASSTDIPKDSATLKAQFGTGSFKLVNGLVLDCFLVIGTQLCVGKFNGDAENEIYIDNITPLENGAIVSMADGKGHCKNYQMLNNETTANITKIWEMIYPMNCRFELFADGNSLSLRGLINTDMNFSGTGTLRGSFYIIDCFDTSMKVDTTDWNAVNDNGFMTFFISLCNGNKAAMYNVFKATSQDRLRTDMLYLGGGGDYKPTSALPFKPTLGTWDGSVSMNDNAATGGATGMYTSAWFNFGCYDKESPNWNLYKNGELAKSLKLNYLFDISHNGVLTMDTVPYFVDPTPAPTMAKARAMSVEPMSIQSEPSTPNVPDDAIGIFSVDEQGHTIDAMTGERI